MEYQLLKGKAGGLWRGSSKDLNIMDRYDKLVLIVGFLSFVVSVILLVILVSKNVDFLNATMVLTVPFFMLGLMWYFHTRKWASLIIILALSVGLYCYLQGGLNLQGEFYKSSDFILIFAIDFIFIGSIGVVSTVTSFQRLIFYWVIGAVEFMNVKDKMTLMERLVAFMFNIPNDIDTRNLTMDYNLKRATIPWSEIWETLWMSLMVGIFLWIYISMSPKFATVGTFGNAPIYIFALVLYIPVIVMPWSIFNALHVRIETKYRDFDLYSGIKGTIKRMILPMFAALVYVLIAIRDNDIMAVASFIATSIFMIIVVVAFTSTIYYFYFENKLVDDIVAKWKVFRPVSLMMTVGEKKESRKDFPGTPKRDMKDFGEFVYEK